MITYSLFLVCEGPQRSVGEDLEGRYEIGVTLEEKTGEDLLVCKTVTHVAVEVEDAPLQSRCEGSAIGQEVKYSEILSAQNTVMVKEDHDLAKDDTLVLKGENRMLCLVQPEDAFITKDEKGTVVSVDKNSKEDVLLPLERDFARMLELKEDEESFLPLKKDGGVLLPVKEDEENLLPKKEDAENVLTLEEDKEIIQPCGKEKVAPGEDEVHLPEEKNENLLPVREDEENLLPVDEDAEIPFPRGKEKISVAVEEVDDILLPKKTDDSSPALKDEEDEEQKQGPEATTVPHAPASPLHTPRGWDEDGAEGWDPEVDEMIGNQGWGW